MTRARSPHDDTELIDLGNPRRVQPQRLAVSKKGMVATAHWAASEAGAEILEMGGNAIDASVASAFALGVCEPAASGIGGQTMMLIHVGARRRTVALDGSSRAPNRAVPRMLSAEDRRRGYCATTVPTTPATLGWALKTYGRLKLKQVLQPAIRLAREGFVVGELLNRLSKRELSALRAHNAGEFFLKEGKRAFREGERLTQPVLAGTLERLALKGIRDFYRGEIARAIHADMVESGGLIRRDDLAQLPWPVERRPVSGRFGPWRVMTMPPPGAGRTLLKVLNVMQQLSWRRTIDTPDGAVALAAILERALIDRTDRPFDPDVFWQSTDKRLLTEEYTKEVAKAVRKRVKTSGETTHLSAMDAEGNAVALTQSIERVFGACVVTPSLGFLYNNYMMAFEHEDISHPYYLRPNASPWASVAPSIITVGQKPFMTIGSPGSERIVSAVAQVMLRLRLGRPPLEAVAAPRLHASLKGKVSFEAPRMRSDIAAALERAGFTVDPREAYSFYLGCVQLVMRDGDELIGVADPRRDGSAKGV